MRVVEIHEPYGIDELKFANRDTPGPLGSRQVLVRMKAASLNFRDLLVVKGEGAWKPPSGRIPLSDGVGEVKAAGSGVSTLRVGDRIMSTILPNWRTGLLSQEKLMGSLGGSAADGILAEFVVFDEDSVVRVPDYLTDVEAATLPCAALTAWHSLTRAQSMERGKTVLVQGSGGVSLFALQFASHAGATVLAISSSNAKLERLSRLGASGGVNYRSCPSWDGEVRRLTQGDGVNHVVDIGGPATLAMSINAAAFHGVVSSVGLIGGLKTELDLFPIFSKNLRIDGIEVGSREMLQQMLEWMTARQLRPVLDSIFSLSQVKESLHHLESGTHVGKICIQL